MKNTNARTQFDHSITIVMIIFTIILFSAFQLSAQEVEKDAKKTNETQSIESPNAPPVNEIKIKNSSGNSIVTITDEGSDKGSITLPLMTLAPSSTTTNKIYNLNGRLYWGSLDLTTSGGASAINDLSDAKFVGSSLFLGFGAGTNDDATSNYNTGVGINTLYDNTGGEFNTASGAYALLSNTTGNNNTASGFNSLRKNTTGINNTANGSEALYSNTTGGDNTANGRYALYSNTTGSANTANGSLALYSNTIGDFNTAVGRSSLFLNTSGNYNIAFGYQALYYNTTGQNNTAIGRSSGPNTNNLSNTTAIGYDATATASNQVRIGNSTVTSIGGYAPWSNLSDSRYKLNVQENVSGLNFIMGLRPVTYNLDINALSEKLGENISIDENGKRTKTQPSAEIAAARSNQVNKRNTGFIAQEVEELAKKLGYDFSGVEVPVNEDGLYSLRYAEFVVPLVKAMQEQQNIITEMRKEIDELKNK